WSVASSHRTVADFEMEARDLLPAALYDSLFVGRPPYAGNIANLAALDRFKLRPRVLQSKDSPVLRTTCLGCPLDFPVMIAPTGLHRRWHPEGELAVAR